jgi:pimeloyl-ACP methyl ester carboxylesterase
MQAAGYRDIWTRSPDGLRLHARLYGEIGTGRLPVLCLPGLARSAVDFHHLATSLALDGRAVLAVDYRGRGLSDHDPDPTHYTVGVETADLLALLAELAITEAVVVGTSRGGLIGMGLAAQKPELIRGLVLNDIGPVIELSGLLRIESYIGKLPEPRDLNEGAAILRSVFAAQFPDLAEEAWLAWAGATWEERDGALVLGYDLALATTLDALDANTKVPDLWPLFEALSEIPLLVIRGALSDLLSAETLAGMAERNPNVQTITVARQGHAPMLQSPDLLRRIGDFVRGVDRSMELSRAPAQNAPVQP